MGIGVTTQATTVNRLTLEQAQYLAIKRFELLFKDVNFTAKRGGIEFVKASEKA